ncbi:MAG: bifunctional hydroxymethylpyrimidine kinase/phosphomethylpyrimidine kinase [Pyrinomonadaceae bacterium]|nr:bifunctional hydroxymethylpyrimidine kinase/phosphomethylpyrimidine kinase [Pyrinomonadaceae bacterium]
MSEQKIALTIAGLDPSGGAGIIADIKTFSAFGCFATSAVTSITFQNTQGVYGAVHQTAEDVRKQIEPILHDYRVSAVKTGMLPTDEVISEVADIVKGGRLRNLVVDPVVRSTSGFDLIDDDALRSLIDSLFPLADLITPNIPEAERISGLKIENEEGVYQAAKIMRDLGARNVLIKGGHSFEKEKGATAAEPRYARDFLFIEDSSTIITADFIETTATHGTGCTLAAAITANLALENDIASSVRIAKEFVTEAIRNAPHIGKGHSPIGIK